MFQDRILDSIIMWYHTYYNFSAEFEIIKLESPLILHHLRIKELGTGKRWSPLGFSF